MTNEELLYRAVNNARILRKVPRWVAVMSLFQLGSTSAQQLCVRVGADPDEVVAPRK